MIHWTPYSVAQGYSGLALLWGYLDACFAEERWDLTGREHLKLAIRAAETSQEIPAGLFSGLSGVGFGAWQLSRRGTRYSRLLSRLDEAIITQVVCLANSLRVQHQGVAVGLFDVISGLSGVGAYLLCRRDRPAVAEALSLVVDVLVELIADESGEPRWRTPACALSETELQDYPHGYLNCGLAHGLPGILAFLSLSLKAGIARPGLAKAIKRGADWLCENRSDDEWGVNWPIAVPLAGRDSPTGQTLRPQGARPTGERASRSAWCYGSPGISRALWLAGDALHMEDYGRLAFSAMEAVFRRPAAARRIDSPSFCHGVTGLLAITLRFAQDAGYSAFVKESQSLVRQLLDFYRPDSLLGFPSLEAPSHAIDQPGLLNGAPGVALVLLGAATGVEPDWDRLFLLS